MKKSSKKFSHTQDAIMRAWVHAPERWEWLWRFCEAGGGRYTRGVFVLKGKPAPTLVRKTEGQIIAELLRSEPMGYLS